MIDWIPYADAKNERVHIVLYQAKIGGMEAKKHAVTQILGGHETGHTKVEYRVDGRLFDTEQELEEYLEGAK